MQKSYNRYLRDRQELCSSSEMHCTHWMNDDRKCLEILTSLWFYVRLHHPHHCQHQRDLGYSFFSCFVWHVEWYLQFFVLFLNLKKVHEYVFYFSSILHNIFTCRCVRVTNYALLDSTFLSLIYDDMNENVPVVD